MHFYWIFTVNRWNVPFFCFKEIELFNSPLFRSVNGMLMTAFLFSNKWSGSYVLHEMSQNLNEERLLGA